jgi:predicted DNA-binding transcriptional regulator YafY
MPMKTTPLKRQIEILGLCLDSGRPLRHSDLQGIFNRDKPTIDRDLRALRSLGIDIHSTKKGVQVASRLGGGLLHELLRHYIGYNYSAMAYDRAIGALVKTLSSDALSIIVQLQMGIEFGRMVMIDYEKEQAMVETGRVICPLLLFQNLNEWRVLAVHEGIRKQYLLSKIRDIQLTAKTFRKPPLEESLEIFNSSWNAWIGGATKHIVKIHFSKELAAKMSHRYFTENQVIDHYDDGAAMLTVQVNSLVEVAMWIVSHPGSRALEPKELVDLVLKMAKDVIKAHE